MTCEAKNPDRPVLKRGDRFPPPSGERDADPATYPRVMGVIDGWVMARRPGCEPFVIFGKDASRLALSIAPQQQGETDE
jgi:hypothetical protein